MSKFHNNNSPFTVKELADFINCEFVGDSNTQITGIAPIQDATKQDLAFINDSSFANNSKYVKFLETTLAGVVLIHPSLKEQARKGLTLILSETPHADYARISNKIFADDATEGYISAKADVDDTAVLAENVTVESGAVVCAGVKLANNVVIGANSYIGKNVEIGEGTIIKSNVSIECTDLGSNCLIHAGAKIGQDGFGFAFDHKKLQFVKVPHIGSVKIGNYVEIGANCTIDRGSLMVTEIGDMTKIDNLVQIAHNVKIGRMCQIVSQTGIAGSTVIGDGCVFGGQSGVAGHLKIADRVVLASRGGISKNINKVGEMLGGFPAVPIKQWHKTHATLMRLVKNK